MNTPSPATYRRDSEGGTDAARQPLRLLLVEDSPDDAALVLRTLRRGGYEPDYLRVQTAEALDEALAQGHVGHRAFGLLRCRTSMACGR